VGSLLHGTKLSLFKFLGVPYYFGGAGDLMALDIFLFLGDAWF
jgi:hypothetical protein